ncbi:MAG: hypothetical protein ABSG03_14625 [Bryobacteraceae bacterium]|jgi:hypothetical protein
MKVTVDDTRLATDWRWQLAQRVVASSGFEKSPRLKAFLLYVTEKALQEHPEEVTEQQIGMHVFGRPAGYDSGSDNVVRSQARLLRTRLEQYFATDGTGESTTIVIPKGAYLPSFVGRPAAHPVSPVRIVGPSRACVGLSAATVVLVAICIWQSVALHRASNGQPTGLSGAFGELWSGIFKRGQDVLVIIPDHTYAMLQASARRDIHLGEYLSEQYGVEVKDLAVRTGLARILPKFYEGHLTGVYAVTDMARIARIQRLTPQELAVRWPRDMTMRDLNSANVVLIGNRNTNPWVELFEDSLNFDFRWNPNEDYNYCVNRSPRPGEAAEYHPTDSGEMREVYGGVAFLPTPQRRGNALLILGTSMAGSEIAAEFITNERLCSTLVERLIREAKGKLPYFEVLLKTTSIAAQAGRVEVVAYRVIPD